jgi:cysteine-rich repeat protein
MQRFHEERNARRGRVSGLRIAVLVALATLAASGSCTIDGGVTRCEKTGLNCPPGWVCSADQDVCIRAGSCGNGIVSDGEVCDDGNNKSGDGCSSDCLSDESCGNFIIDVAVGENCDDGNRIDGDGCSAGCRLERCGNYFVDMAAGEECDTGPGDSVGCNADCTFRRCGDGHVNTAAEDCDVLGMTGPTATCDGDCTFPACGDLYVNQRFTPPGDDAEPEQCDDGSNTQSCNGDDNANSTAEGEGNCQKPACGDNYFNPAFTPPGNDAEPEQCDDGDDTQECNGNHSGTGRGICQTPACGDGYFNPQFTPPGADAEPEQCDTRVNTQECNGNDNDNSTAKGKGNCQVPRCGDGYVNTQFRPSGPVGPPEACDAGIDTPSCNGNGPGNGAAKCQIPRCGDGYVNAQFRPAGSAGPPEACDAGMDTPSCNGNGSGNDAAKCQVPMCRDGYFNSTMEQCDPDAPDPDGPCEGEEQCDSLCTCM